MSRCVDCGSPISTWTPTQRPICANCFKPDSELPIYDQMKKLLAEWLELSTGFYKIHLTAAQINGISIHNLTDKTRNLLAEES